MTTNYRKKTYPKDLLGESAENSPSLSEILPDAENEYEDFPVRIEPAGVWLNHNWREIWEHRELFYFLTLRDIKIRYKQTLMGIAWVLLQPTVSTIVFSIIFANIGQSTDLAAPYPVYAFSGFAIWLFFATAISGASASLIGNPSLITKVYFPRIILPLSAVAANLLDLVLGLASLAVIAFIYGVVPGWTIVFAPLFLLLIIVKALSLGIILSSINVRYRDIKYILPFALQLWLFVTPIFYSLEMIPEKARWTWKLNPMTGALGGFRSALFNTQFDWQAIGFSAAVTLLLVVFALQIFYRMEDGFADVI